MENLRWILILAGVGILVLLYFSGKPKRSNSQRESLNKSRPMSEDDMLNGDPLMGELGEKSSHSSQVIGHGGQSDSAEASFNDFDATDLDDFTRPAGEPKQPLAKSGGLSSISSKIDAFSEKLSPKRRARVAASEANANRAAEKEAYSSKIVTLHVVAPRGQLFDGEQLLGLFEQRGYHYGDMNIFHSMHQDKTVFSIAKVVEPGTFDINQISSFDTPGISLILQLPGPVAADVAFEVLISEAFDMANTLGGTVLDADRSTLSKQTVQHMREGVYEYMHRQKYFSGVAS
ncbi:MAG: cell division protein ZipA [Granulosicoccaceae bacterium]